MGARKFLLLKADIDREMAQVERLLEESRSDLRGVGGIPSRLEVRGGGERTARFLLGG